MRRLLSIILLSTCATALIAAALVSGVAPAGTARLSAAPAEEEGEIPDKPVLTFDPPSTPRRGLAAGGGTNVRANQDSSGRDQNETTIASNPLDPLNLIGGANDARGGSWGAGLYVSHDGGASFSDGVMPFRKYGSQGDPTIAFCGDGTALYGYLDYDGSFAPHRLIVSASTDGGDTWSNPGTVHEGSLPFADKPYIACAPSGGAFGNRAYVSWTHFSNPFSGAIRVVYSDDHGQTWQGAKTVSGPGTQGSIPVPGRDGEVYVFWNGPSGIEFSRSTNGGASWSPAGTVSAVSGIAGTSFRRNSFPTAAIDVSAGAGDGNVYVAWSDDRDGDPDIYFTRSTDGGVNWDPPFRVNDDGVGNARDQFFPWMAVDEAGNVHLMWHDRRDDAANDRIHVYIATSRDGGLSFDRNLRVSDVSAAGSLTGFLGDYAALTAGHGRIVPLWSDLRAGTGEEDVYIEVEPIFDYDIVSAVRFSNDKQSLAFEDQEPRLGSAIVYDLLRGPASSLRDADPFALAGCLAEDLAGPPASDADLPPAGEAFYYILRGQGPRGLGSYGSGSGHPDARDGLDDASPCGG